MRVEENVCECYRLNRIQSELIIVETGNWVNQLTRIQYSTLSVFVCLKRARVKG